MSARQQAASVVVEGGAAGGAAHAAERVALLVEAGSLQNFSDELKGSG